MTGRLKGKICVVTGATRGIGRGCAIALAEEGATIYITGRSNGDGPLTLNDSVAAIEQAGGVGIATQVDHANDHEIEAFFKKVAEEAGHIDILVNNAGSSGLEGDSDAHDRLLQSYSESSGEPDLPILSVTNEAWSKMLAVHLDGTFFCSRAALRIMMRHGDRISGSTNIINMGSIMGTAGGAGAIAYCSAKAGILGLTRALARELAPYKIRVNALAPGQIYTDMISSLEDMHPALIAQTPLGHLGETDDIAWAAVYLASNEAKFVTGQTLSPNGGWHMSQ